MSAFHKFPQKQFLTFNSVDILNQVDSPFPLRGVGEINFPKEKIHRYGSKQRVVQKCDFKTLPGSG